MPVNFFGDEFKANRSQALRSPSTGQVPMGTRANSLTDASGQTFTGPNQFARLRGIPMNVVQQAWQRIFGGGQQAAGVNWPGVSPEITPPDGPPTRPPEYGGGVSPEMLPFPGGGGPGAFQLPTPGPPFPNPPPQDVPQVSAGRPGGVHISQVPGLNWARPEITTPNPTAIRMREALQRMLGGRVLGGGPIPTPDPGSLPGSFPGGGSTSGLLQLLLRRGF